MPPLHPALVHFPIALLAAGFVCDLLALILHQKEMERVGWWALVAGTVGILAAIASGLLEKEGLTLAPPAAESLELHQQTALLAAATFIALLLWRIGKRNQFSAKERMIGIAWHFAALLFLLMTAWEGGVMVYRLGVGVAP